MNETPQGTETVHTTPASPLTHERYDMSFRPVILFGVALVALTVVVLFLMSAFFASMAARRAHRDTPLSPLALSRPQIPPEPRLQLTPNQELQQERQAEDALLHSYGWVDRAAGVVRIPIEQAMDLLATRGLPTRLTAPAAQSEDKRP